MTKYELEYENMNLKNKLAKVEAELEKNKKEQALKEYQAVNRKIVAYLKRLNMSDKSTSVLLKMFDTEASVDGEVAVSLRELVDAFDRESSKDAKLDEEHARMKQRISDLVCARRCMVDPFSPPY